MKKRKVTCFLPCRKGSERIPEKNVKPFAGIPKGLIEIKLAQLLMCKEIDEVVLSTNDEEILDYASKLNAGNLRIHHRDDRLASSATSTDELVNHAASLIPEGHILWTHVTSPFINAAKYSQIITKYFEMLEEGFDSLMTTTPIYGFLWKGNQPLNYDRAIEKWPRTQTLSPIEEVNSGAFLTSASVYKTHEDRIGRKPFLFQLDRLLSHDIDWPEDFVLAECMVKEKLVEL